MTDVGPYIGGIRWRRCAVCRQRVWETKRGKLSSHLAEHPNNGDALARDPFSAKASDPRCTGSGT